MAKAETLGADALTVAPTVPKAATPARSPKLKAEPVEKVEIVPMQLRIPKDTARAIKVAAAQSDQTISDFMQTCFHAHMKTIKHA